MLKAYQQTLSKDTLYWEFKDCEDLYRLGSHHLASVIHKLISELRDDLALEAPPKGSGGAPVVPIAPTDRKSGPNIAVTDIRETRIAPVGPLGQWTMNNFGQLGLIIQFTNEAKRGVPANVGAIVRAVLVYYVDGKEALRIIGNWLDEFDLPTFRVDDTHSLVVAVAGQGDFSALGTYRRTVAVGSDQVDVKPSRFFPIPPKIDVLVRLTDANKGDVLYEGEFLLSTGPLRIVPVT